VAKHPGKCPRCGYHLLYETAVDEQLVCPQCQATLAVPGKVKRGDRVDPLLGAKLGQFEILEVLGRGGMASVYRARQTALDRLCAIKVLPKALAKDESFVARFQREARSVAAVSHPNIIEIYDVGNERGYQYIAMELVEGESLSAVLKRDGPLAPALALGFLKQTAAALAAAHAKGIVHRDIKPSNLLVRKDGAIKVADFGLAKRMGSDTGVTRTGQIIGTALYLPPEVAMGERADERSDLYSVGATFYHLISGRPPFEAPTLAELVMKHTESDVPPLSEVAPDAPAPVCDIIDRLVRKSRDERFRSAAELLDAAAQAEQAISGVAPPPQWPAHTPYPAPYATPPGGIPAIAPPTPFPPLPAVGAGQHAGEHFHLSYEARMAAHKKQQRKMALLLILGGIAGAAIVVGLIILAVRPGRENGPKTGDHPGTGTVPDARLTPEDLKDFEAEQRFLDAQRAVQNQNWLSAQSFLRRLRTEYAKTRFYSRNSVAIDALWSKVESELRPKTPPPDTPAPPPDKAETPPGTP